MMERYRDYVLECNQFIPIRVNVGLLVLFCLGSVMLLAQFGYKIGSKWSTRLLLGEFLFWLVALTVLFRPALDVRMFDFNPFWSYRAVKAGNGLILTQIIMNMVAFIPIGFLLGCSFRKMKWWKVALFAAIFSFLIETLQFVTKRGFAEFDDVFHNVIGCLIGYGLYMVLSFLIRSISTSKLVVHKKETSQQY